ncbi:MAG: Imm1 family immunity protein [Paracoccaceae bacterium]
MNASSTLTINGELMTTPDPVAEIKTAIQGPSEYLEIWLKQQDGTALSSLVNSTNAFLIWMTPECPEGWHSIADQTHSAEPREFSFRLANGQVDLFPEESCVPRGNVIQAFQSFWVTGARPPSINWCYT